MQCENFRAYYGRCPNAAELQVVRRYGRPKRLCRKCVGKVLENESAADPVTVRELEPSVKTTNG